MSFRAVSISEAAAQSVQGAGIYGGLCDLAVSTTKTFFDLTAWKGRCITVSVTGDAYYKWAHVTGETLDITTEHLVASTAGTTGADIAGRLEEGSTPLVVPMPYPSATPTAGDAVVGLLIAAVASTIDVRIHPS
jgi:hypothetical protein